MEMIMSERPKRPLGRRIQARVMGVLNVPMRVLLRGRDALARPELIKDPDEIERLLAVMAAANPSVNAFVGIPKGPDGRLDRGRLETAVRYGFRIVRWQLEEQAA